MLSSPVPSGGCRRIESGTVVADGEAQLGLVAVEDEPDVDPVATVLERVLQRLRETEVHGSLHLGIEAPGRADVDGRITREGGDGVSQGRARPPSDNAIGWTPRARSRSSTLARRS